MTKRRKHPLGTGKGRHGSEVQPAGKRPPGEVKPIISRTKHGKMTRNFHDNDERPITDGCAGILAAIIALMLMFPRCGHGQDVFRFNTSAVVMVDTSGQMDAGLASWPVVACGDSLFVGIPTRPLKWRGLKWVLTDNGDLHCIKPYFWAHYKPGPGGKSLMIRPMGAIRVIELYERPTTKL